MMRHLLISILIMFLSGVVGKAQGTLIAEFTMDQCNLENDLGVLSGDLFGASSCVCGVRSNGLVFDGSIAFGTFDAGFNDVLMGDWTMSFYVRVDNAENQTVDLFYLGENCGRDSVFSVKYFSSSGRFRVRLSDSPNNEVQVDGQSDPNSCWQYVAIVKESSRLSLYINGVLTEQNASISSLALNVDARLSISNSPCLTGSTNPDSKLMGRIDELRFYDYPLSQMEIGLADYRPDQILINDTTIFVGNSVLIATGGSCSDDFTWMPSRYLNDPNRLNPVATPEETTTYTLEIRDGGCTIVNSVQINVVSTEEISCEQLQLPTAFTPNGDRVNDRFGISNGFLVERIEGFEIFNRWGGRVFYADDVTGSWDGNYKGQKAPPASYVYLVRYLCGGQLYQKTGTLHLIR